MSGKFNIGIKNPFNKVECDQIATITQAIGNMIGVVPHDCVITTLDEGGFSLTMTFAKQVDNTSDQSIYCVADDLEDDDKYSYVAEALGPDDFDDDTLSDDAPKAAGDNTELMQTTLYRLTAKATTPLAAAGEILREVNRQQAITQFPDAPCPAGALH